jgi:hypothetical protein
VTGGGSTAARPQQAIIPMCSISTSESATGYPNSAGTRPLARSQTAAASSSHDGRVRKDLISRTDKVRITRPASG